MYGAPFTPAMPQDMVYPVASIPMVQSPWIYAPQPTPATLATPQCSLVPQMQLPAAPIYQQPLRLQKNKGNAVLFVGQLNYDVTERDVRQLFSYYGTVVNVVLLKDGKKNGKNGAVVKNKQVVGSSAFVTYSTTAEADVAIISLHNRYCMDNREKPVQVSYCQKTDIISDFGYRHALQLHAENPANPIPSINITPSVAYAIKYA